MKRLRLLVFLFLMNSITIFSQCPYNFTPVCLDRPIKDVYDAERVCPSICGKNQYGNPRWGRYNKAHLTNNYYCGNFNPGNGACCCSNN